MFSKLFTSFCWESKLNYESKKLGLKRMDLYFNLLNIMVGWVVKKQLSTIDIL